MLVVKHESECAECSRDVILFPFFFRFSPFNDRQIMLPLVFLSTLSLASAAPVFEQTVFGLDNKPQQPVSTTPSLYEPIKNELNPLKRPFLSSLSL
jgi:hypothetical protein